MKLISGKKLKYQWKRTLNLSFYIQLLVSCFRLYFLQLNYQPNIIFFQRNIFGIWFLSQVSLKYIMELRTLMLYWMNSSKNIAVSSTFIAVLAFLTERSFSASIWLVVAFSSFFFLDWSLNNASKYQKVIQKVIVTGSIYNMYPDYGRFCFVSLLILHNLISELL